MVCFRNSLFFALLALIFACAGSQPSVKPGAPRAYKIHGNWYQPLLSAENFTEKGRASWYGKKFHGRKTANGEIYNMYALTAAHKTLPLGTWLRVKNLENGRSVEVRVNDRGPFVDDRIIDLSYKAASLIDMTASGTARVKIKAIDKRDYPDRKPKPACVYSVQTGSFAAKKNADAFRKELDKIYKNVHIVFENGAYKIRIGKFSSRADAEKTKTELKKAGYTAFLVQV